MDEQEIFTVAVVAKMAEVLVRCQKEKEDCVCSMRVSYVNDPKMPENMRYRTSIYCAKKGDQFHTDATTSLEAMNKSVDVMKN